MTDQQSETRCPSCGHEGGSFVLRKESDGKGPGPISLLHCLACELTFLESWGDDFEPDLYDYYRERLGRSKVDLYLPLTDKSYLRLLDHLLGLARGDRLLDVGCGQGQFVNAALQKGWKAEGIELSASAIEICLSFGLPCRVQDFFSDELDNRTFDVITMFELLEHVAAPGDFLRRAEDLLSPGGLLYLTTPNFKSLSRRALGPQWRAVHRGHITYFTPRTLRNVVRRSTSFELLRLATVNTSGAAVRKLLMRSPSAAQATPDERYRVAEHSSDSDSSKEQQFRHRVEESTALRALKPVANFLLNLTRLGDKITLVLRKPD